jgi:uncharacterized membrane protein YkoI
MREKIKAVVLAVAGFAVVAAPIGIADAAKKKHAKKHQTAKRQSTTTTGASGNSAETVLTGDTKTQAEDAAKAANPGATVERSSTEDPSDASGAKYEVHMTKADGSEIEVLLDASFAVISSKASEGHHGGRGGDHGGDHGGPGNETELTGATKTSAEAAALAAVPGGTVERSSAEDPSDASGAKYEVHVTKADGSEVEVLEDASFTVLSTKADDHGGHGGRRG